MERNRRKNPPSQFPQLRANLGSKLEIPKNPHNMEPNVAKNPPKKSSPLRRGRKKPNLPS